MKKLILLFIVFAIVMPATVLAENPCRVGERCYVKGDQQVARGLENYAKMKVARVEGDRETLQWMADKNEIMIARSATLIEILEIDCQGECALVIPWKYANYYKEGKLKGMAFYIDYNVLVKN